MLRTQVEDDRQRAVIREALDETLFVAAGAGTGKTRALVDRFLALVLAGRPIDRIVAITFTEKAAAELRDRVRAGLEEALVENAEQQELITAAL
ncbi:MAG: UvrD-helicase domain-containing protein, partial [Chloroflexi bacterium]|nr:UvrD-helicase domain-containing protein [Chloroflexota bacterium]